MENNKKEEMPDEEQGRDSGLGNITEKEFIRDMVNPYLPEADLIGDDDNDDYLKKLYGEDFLEGLDYGDEEDSEEE
ncbi:hypothetical protein [Pontibacter harenae]|uniref:hypothetical protein n=1 Tax=Pontibacter harenae TaxID=2894083 RepID=UPI001E3502E9|nr:hypothetical protein [Pontibacter harenae]MCC9169077.1 hypothetical protein [Pontibacter harenae]